MDVFSPKQGGVFRCVRALSPLLISCALSMGLSIACVANPTPHPGQSTDERAQDFGAPVSASESVSSEADALSTEAHDTLSHVQDSGREEEDALALNETFESGTSPGSDDE